MATRTYYANKDTTIRRTVSTNRNVGTGTDYHNIVGRDTGEYVYRTAIQFNLDSFPSAMYNVSSAVIQFKVSTENAPAFLDYDVLTHGAPLEGNPTIKAYHISGTWTEGTFEADNLGFGDAAAETNGGGAIWTTFAVGDLNGFTTKVDTATYGNTVSVPSGAVQVSEGGSGTIVEVDVRNSFLRWAPTSVNGGQNQTNYGVLICLADENDTGQRVNFISRHRTADVFSTNAVYPDINEIIWEPRLVVTYTAAPSPTPTVDADSPNGTNSLGIVNITNLSDAQIWSSTSDYAQGEFSWTFTPSLNGNPIKSWQLKIYEGTNASGTLVYDSGTVTDSAHISDGYLETTPNTTKPSWLPGGWQTGYNGLKNGTDYAWQITAIDTANQTDLSGVARFRARWGQALYEFDAGASYSATSSWLVDYDTPPSNTQAVELYQATNVRSQAIVTNITAAAGTITFTCAGGHNFIAGDIVTITGVAPDAYNLTNVTVNPTGLTATAFTVTNAATGTFVTGTQGYATLVAYETRTATITNVTAASGTVTYTTSSAHGFVAGQKVTITGVAPTAYNLANVTLATASGSSFTVTNAATGTFVSGGKAIMHGRRGISAPLTDISGSGSVITFTGANDFLVGQQVAISGSSVAAFNDTSATIASATASSFTVAGATSATYTISSLTATGTSVTYTTTANHGFSVGNLVVVSGCTPSGYNTAATGSRITAKTNTTFTIDNATTGALTVAGSARVLPVGAVAESIISTSGGEISGQARYLHAHIRTSVNNASSSAQPVLNNVQFTYLSATQTPDYWSSAGPSGNTAVYILDSDTRRFGTKSVKVTSAGSGDAFLYPYRVVGGDDIAVVPNTIYSFSCYIKIGKLTGANNVRLRIYPGGTSDPSAVAVLADSGPHTGYAADNEYWRRLSITFTTGSATHTVRPMIYMPNSAGVANDYFWADGILFEEGTVVRSWTPGFVTSGVTFEGGGLNIDTSNGGVLRLRGGDAGARDQISVGAKGLLFGGDTSPVQVYSSTAGLLDVSGAISATGAITGTSFNKVAITQPANSATLNISDGKTLNVSNTLTLSGTDSASVNLGAGGTVLYNPMTAAGDLIIGGTSGAATRLGKGTQNYVLTAGASTISWAAPTSTGGVGAWAAVAAAIGADASPVQTLSATDSTLSFNSGAETIDTGSGITFTAGTGPTQSRFTVANAGWYLVEGGFAARITSTGGQDMGGGIYVNGSQVARLYVQHRNPATAIYPWVRFGGPIYLAANDYVQAKGFSTGGGNCNSKFLTIVRL